MSFKLIKMDIIKAKPSNYIPLAKENTTKTILVKNKVMRTRNGRITTAIISSMLEEDNSENLCYELVIREQPKNAICVGLTDKDRKPIEPSPIIQLSVYSEKREPHIQCLYNSNFFIVASLVEEKQTLNAEGKYVYKTLDIDKFKEKKLLLGTSVASLNRLKDVDGSSGTFFIFHDITVRNEGAYRLKFSLYEMKGAKTIFRTSTISEVFNVYTPKSFPGYKESSSLAKCFAEQGFKIRIKKDINVPRKRYSKYSNDVWLNDNGEILSKEGFLLKKKLLNENESSSSESKDNKESSFKNSKKQDNNNHKLQSPKEKSSNDVSPINISYSNNNNNNNNINNNNNNNTIINNNDNNNSNKRQVYNYEYNQPNDNNSDHTFTFERTGGYVDMRNRKEYQGDYYSINSRPNEYNYNEQQRMNEEMNVNINNNYDYNKRNDMNNNYNSSYSSKHQIRNSNGNKNNYRSNFDNCHSYNESSFKEKAYYDNNIPSSSVNNELPMNNPNGQTSGLNRNFMRDNTPISNSDEEFSRSEPYLPKENSNYSRNIPSIKNNLNNYPIYSNRNYDNNGNNDRYNNNDYTNNNEMNESIHYYPNSNNMSNSSKRSFDEFKNGIRDNKEFYGKTTDYRENNKNDEYRYNEQHYYPYNYSTRDVPVINNNNSEGTYLENRPYNYSNNNRCDGRGSISPPLKKSPRPYENGLPYLERNSKSGDSYHLSKKQPYYSYNNNSYNNNESINNNNNSNYNDTNNINNNYNTNNINNNYNNTNNININYNNYNKNVNDNRSFYQYKNLTPNPYSPEYSNDSSYRDDQTSLKPRHTIRYQEMSRNRNKMPYNEMMRGREDIPLRDGSYNDDRFKRRRIDPSSNEIMGPAKNMDRNEWLRNEDYRSYPGNDLEYSHGHSNSNSSSIIPNQINNNTMPLNCNNNSNNNNNNSNSNERSSTQPYSPDNGYPEPPYYNNNNVRDCESNERKPFYQYDTNKNEYNGMCCSPQSEGFSGFNNNNNGNINEFSDRNSSYDNYGNNYGDSGNGNHFKTNEYEQYSLSKEDHSFRNNIREIINPENDSCYKQDNQENNYVRKMKNEMSDPYDMEMKSMKYENYQNMNDNKRDNIQYPLTPNLNSSNKYETSGFDIKISRIIGNSA